MTPNIQTTRKSFLPTSPMKTKKRGKSKTSRSSLSDDNKENMDRVYDPNSMDFELESGVDLISRFIQQSQVISNKQSLQNFEETLVKKLRSEYAGHWYPDHPLKGSGFRCLRINQNGGESLIEKTARSCGIDWIIDCLPKEFTIWIDPGEVSYRIGEDGSICVHYNHKQVNNTKRITPVK